MWPMPSPLANGGRVGQGGHKKRVERTTAFGPIHSRDSRPIRPLLPFPHFHVSRLSRVLPSIPSAPTPRPLGCFARIWAESDVCTFLRIFLRTLSKLKIKLNSTQTLKSLIRFALEIDKKKITPKISTPFLGVFFHNLRTCWKGQKPKLIRPQQRHSWPQMTMPAQPSASRLISFIPLLFLLGTITSTAFGQVQRPQQQQLQQKHSFRENCADEHDKELLSCRVSTVDCSQDFNKLFPSTSSSASSPSSALGFPGEGHDLRIEPFAKATTRQNVDGQGQNVNGSLGHSGGHQLLVDISWQTAPNNATRALKAFLLEIEGEAGRKHACFLLDLSATNWSEQAVTASPRLHFATDSLFQFGQNYELELYSLPERAPGSGASVHSRFTTPHNPNPSSGPHTSANCSKRSNQFASKWTAGFRHIYVHSAARTLQVEFVGAPAQYCFEQYEIRLLDESGMEMLHSGTVAVEEMSRNGSLLLGQYNFTDLEYDQSYIPSVIPVERAADGRCLCPVFGTDPYDVKVVCSCVAADWKPIRMARPDILKLCPGCLLNGTAILPAIDFEQVVQERNKTSILWILLLVFNALFLLLIFLLVVAYLRCRLSGAIPRKDQFRRIRFVSPSANSGPPCASSALSSSTSGANSLAIRTNLTLGTVSASSSLKTPLIGAEEMQNCSTASSSPLSLLIVYAHDCEEHEQAVLALAEFLRDSFAIHVHIDRWDQGQIEANLVDWLSASVVSADKVLIVNSPGAWERYRAKITSQGRWMVERKEADLLDRIFLAHIDMALQHHSIVSARFDCSSPADHTLPMLQGLLQYNVPDNICPLVSALFGRNMRQDERLATTALAGNGHLAKMRECLKQLEQKCKEEPNWLSESHHRRVFSGKMTIVPEAAGHVALEIEEEEAKEEKQEQIVPKMDVDEEKWHEKALLAQRQPGNDAKLDSGIFEWAGSDEEAAARDRAESGSHVEVHCTSNAEQEALLCPRISSADDYGSGDSGVVTGEMDSSAHQQQQQAEPMYAAV